MRTLGARRGHNSVGPPHVLDHTPETLVRFVVHLAGGAMMTRRQAVGCDFYVVATKARSAIPVRRASRSVILCQFATRRTSGFADARTENDLLNECFKIESVRLLTRARHDTSLGVSR